MDEPFEFSQELEYASTAGDFCSLSHLQENVNQHLNQPTSYQAASLNNNLLVNETGEWQEEAEGPFPGDYAGEDEAYYQEDYNAEEEEALQKPMADFASQRFKRIKKPDQTSAAKKPKPRERGDDEDENEEEIDEADQAEADEFYSQLIPETTDNLEVDNEKARPLCRKRPRWHAQEAQFFQQCAALFDCNYTMIHDFLPHRTVADLKKQYDKQRSLYASLYASFGTTPRFDSLQEYHQLKSKLEEAKQNLDQSMRNLGVRPWAEASDKRTGKDDQDSQDIEEEEEYEQEEEEVIGPDHF